MRFHAWRRHLTVSQSPRYGLGPCLDTPPSIGQGVFDRKCRSGCCRLKMDGESGVRVEEVLLVASACLSGSSRQGGALHGLWVECWWPILLGGRIATA